MPAQRLHRQTIAIRPFDVIGQDSGGVQHFVRHVGLSSERRDEFKAEDTISFTHMGPPLENRSAPGPIHSMGSVPLTVDEIQQINVFVDERDSEYQAQQIRNAQYVIRPHVEPMRDADGTILFYRFNCAGFVIEAYRFVGIDLLATQDEALPPVPLSLLLAAYPDKAMLLQDARMRQRMNLPGNGPWPVVLAGYVLNALVGEEAEVRAGVPYRAAIGDEHFPPRRV